MREAQQRRLLGDFGSRVRAAREERGLSQEALAHLAGVHPSYQGGVERGDRNPGLLNVIRIADALEIDPSGLVEGLTLKRKRAR